MLLHFFLQSPPAAVTVMEEKQNPIKRFFHRLEPFSDFLHLSPCGTCGHAILHVLHQLLGVHNTFISAPAQKHFCRNVPGWHYSAVTPAPHVPPSASFSTRFITTLTFQHTSWIICYVFLFLFSLPLMGASSCLQFLKRRYF